MDAKVLNDKGVMTRLVMVKRRVLTRSLHTVLDVHKLFTRYCLKWIARILGTYSEEIVQEFYAFYVETLRGSLDRQVKVAKQDPLTTVLVRGCRVDISLITICCFMYGTSTNITRFPLTLNFYYRWDMVKSCQFQRIVEQKEVGKRLLAQHLSIDGDETDWVLYPKGMIKKANLTFKAKFFWLLVCHRLSPTETDNILTWDRAVLEAS